MFAIAAGFCALETAILCAMAAAADALGCACSVGILGWPAGAPLAPLANAGAPLTTPPLPRCATAAAAAPLAPRTPPPRTEAAAAPRPLGTTPPRGPLAAYPPRARAAAPAAAPLTAAIILCFTASAALIAGEPPRPLPWPLIAGAPAPLPRNWVGTGALCSLGAGARGRAGLIDTCGAGCRRGGGAPPRWRPAATMAI